jgi:NDP-sugar pyrophosphorylase family protein
VAGAQTYARFFAEARRQEQAAVTLALTSPGNDENPLFVRTRPGNSRVVAIGEAAAPSAYATAGVYAVRASILREADAARRDGVDALRTFLGRLLDRDYQLAGIPIAEAIDVDRPADIGTAEAFLRSASI